ncbi:MAG: DNA repair protein RadC [Muribaculaceae bacterium]|nr:DNA repair protein RadC [Muribaculaceae bacterium]
MDTSQEYSGKMSISLMADDDKPREKAIAKGVRNLSTSELLAIVIGAGLPGKPVTELSAEILQSCGGSLTRLSHMSIAGMQAQFRGIGPAKAVGIAAALELARRMRDEEPARMPKITCAEDAYKVISEQFYNLPTEEFWVMLLSRANRVLSFECISRGGTVATYVETKLIIKHAVEALACGMILVHNHPSGQLSPSGQDDALTRKIKAAAELLDIKVLDHLIIGTDGFYSYADNGRL